MLESMEELDDPKQPDCEGKTGGRMFFLPPDASCIYWKHQPPARARYICGGETSQIGIELPISDR